MKRLILFELIILFLATTFESDSPPGWFQQVLPVSDQINDIFFLDSLTGWVVTDGRTSTNDTGYIMKTSDEGSNWTVQYNQPMKHNVVQFLDNNTGYVAGGSGSGTARFFKTTNSGTNWNLMSVLGYGDLEDMFFVNKDTGWVCDANAFGGLAKTENGGINWQQQLNDSYSPEKLFFINKDTGWIISAGNRLYRTDNSGVTWYIQMNFFSNDLVDIFSVNKDTAWIHGGPTGIYKTTNGGVNWDTQSTPFGYGNGKMYFTDSHHGWVGRSNARMLITTDGINWGYQNTPPGSHFSVQMIDTLKGWAGFTNLIHTTDGGGPQVGIQQISNEIPSEYRLYQNYPNPFNPKTIIRFQITRPSDVKLTVYDIQGKEITTLVNEEQKPGTYQADWNASDYPSGVYFYSLIIDGIITNTRKMMLIK